jgi:hypothetical protein
MGPLSRALVWYLDRPHRYRPYGVVQSEDVLRAVLRPADVLLVEGNTRISTAIKHLTQSTWSHAALYVGSDEAAGPGAADAPVLIPGAMVH